MIFSDPAINIAFIPLTRFIIDAIIHSGHEITPTSYFFYNLSDNATRELECLLISQKRTTLDRLFELQKRKRRRATASANYHKKERKVLPSTSISLVWPSLHCVCASLVVINITAIIIKFRRRVPVFFSRAGERTSHIIFYTSGYVETATVAVTSRRRSYVYIYHARTHSCTTVSSGLGYSRYITRPDAR